MATLLKMTLSGSMAIIWVLLARLLLCRSPKIYSYVLWAVVLLRLLCPVFPEAQVSLIAQPVSVQESLHAFQQETAPQIGLAASPSESETESSILPIIWASGVLFMAGSGLAQLFSLKRKLRTAVLERENIYLCEWVASPFVLGLFRPRIYLPSAVEEKEFIIAHERFHIRRMDHWAKLVGYIVLCIHWFNPMVWLAFRFACRDMEMSCDEAVLSQMGEHVRSDYSQSLLNLAAGNHMGGITPAFGEGDVKMRIKNVLSWKQPTWWSKVLCGIVCLVVLAGCAFDPLSGEIVRYEKDGIVMQLEVPEGWEYQLVESWQHTDKWGITLKPEELEWDEAEVFLVHWPEGFIAARFYERTDYVLDSGANVRVGSYYGLNKWDYIFFMDEKESFVLHAWHTNDWWDEYGEECIEIINSIKFE